jgi:pyridoxamine 5'-phosphate oxidase
VAELNARPLRRIELLDEPASQFAAWYDEADGHVAFREAVALATATPEGRPSVRMVLLKDHGPAGLTFFTGHESRKGRELAANPRAALCFYFYELGRQVRIEGRVERLPPADCDAYFATRPRGSQLSASVSRQSQPIASRRLLEEAVTGLDRSLGAGAVARPERWGGYRLLPDLYEFWQHRDDRLHDRFAYTREGTIWRIERLSP